MCVRVRLQFCNGSCLAPSCAPFAVALHVGLGRRVARMDPFRAVQEEVRGTLSDIQAELAKWHKLPARSPKSEPARQRILSSLSELQVDLQDMQATIDIALRDPAKFALTPSELMARQDFVRDLQAQANDARESLESPAQPSRALSGRASSQRNDRQTLLSSCGRSSQDLMSPSPVQHECGCGDRGGSSHAAWRDNESACSSGMQQQEQIIERQDVELGAIGKSVDRLGEMGRVINSELKSQGRELDAFTEEVSGMVLTLCLSRGRHASSTRLTACAHLSLSRAGGGRERQDDGRNGCDEEDAQAKGPREAVRDRGAHAGADTPPLRRHRVVTQPTLGVASAPDALRVRACLGGRGWSGVK